MTKESGPCGARRIARKFASCYTGLAAPVRNNVRGLSKPVLLILKFRSRYSFSTVQYSSLHNLTSVNQTSSYAKTRPA